MEIPERLYSNIGFMIADVARLYRLVFDREMQPVGLTRSQWWALVNVYYYDGINQKELSELIEIDKSAIAKLLGRLEAKGWIKKVADESDGRAQRIFLSQEIRPVMERIITLSDKLIEKSLENVSDTRLKALRGGIQQIDASLSEMLDETPEDIASVRNDIRAEIDKITRG